jgi:hypothetical protein
MCESTRRPLPTYPHPPQANPRCPPLHPLEVVRLAPHADQGRCSEPGPYDPPRRCAPGHGTRPCGVLQAQAALQGEPRLSQLTAGYGQARRRRRLQPPQGQHLIWLCWWGRSLVKGTRGLHGRRPTVWAAFWISPAAVKLFTPAGGIRHSSQEMGICHADGEFFSRCGRPFWHSCSDE